MLWPGEARGRTLSGAIVIMDEWQNSSENTTQLILSRLDNTCKAIVIGSNRQIDNPYLSKYNNGLTKLLMATHEDNNHLRMFAIELEKAVRGRFAEFAEEQFEKNL
jgi:PhoH-like ATPase